MLAHITDCKYMKYFSLNFSLARESPGKKIFHLSLLFRIFIERNDENPAKVFDPRVWKA
jgi:hypothetical protein